MTERKAFWSLCFCGSVRLRKSTTRDFCMGVADMVFSFHYHLNSSKFFSQRFYTIKSWINFSSKLLENPFYQNSSNSWLMFSFSIHRILVLCSKHHWTCKPELKLVILKEMFHWNLLFKKTAFSRSLETKTLAILKCYDLLLVFATTILDLHTYSACRVQ